MHDVAISVWGIKGWYDYIRPNLLLDTFQKMVKVLITLLKILMKMDFQFLDGYIEVIQPEDPLAGDSDEKCWKNKIIYLEGS